MSPDTAPDLRDLAREDLDNQRLAVNGCRVGLTKAMARYAGAFTADECRAADLALGRAMGDLSAAVAKYGAACDRLAAHRRDALRAQEEGAQ